MVTHLREKWSCAEGHPGLSAVPTPALHLHVLYCNGHYALLSPRKLLQGVLCILLYPRLAQGQAQRRSVINVTDESMSGWMNGWIVDEPGAKKESLASA